MRLAILAILLVAAGCAREPAPGGDGAEPVPPLAAPAATASAATAATAAPAAQVEPWTVVETGAGVVRLGMTATELQPFLAPSTASSPAGECRYEQVAGAPEGVMVMVVDDQVRRIDVTTPGVATAVGAAVGALEANVRIMYPRLREQPHKYTDGRYLIVDLSSDRRLVFESEHGTVSRYRVGLIPEVDWVEGCS